MSKYIDGFRDRRSILQFGISTIICSYCVSLIRQFPKSSDRSFGQLVANCISPSVVKALQWAILSVRSCRQCSATDRMAASARSSQQERSSCISAPQNSDMRSTELLDTPVHRCSSSTTNCGASSANEQMPCSDIPLQLLSFNCTSCGQLRATLSKDWSDISSH